MTQPLRIFISYKRENQSFAEELREQLIAWGYRTWMDIYDIPKGAYWPDEIDAGLQASDVVIGVMSPQAIQSRNVKNEWDWAIVNRRRLIPLMLESCVVPMNYVSINYIDFTKDKRRGFDNLRAALEQPHTPPAPADPYRPYLEKLYQRINTYLAQKIVPTLRDDQDRPEPIRLQSEATPNAVLFEKRQEIDPLFAIGGIQIEGVTEHEQVYDDFERAFEHYDGRVLLLGEPGAGKTITLLHFGRDAVVRRIQDPTQPLPILLIVPTWDAEKHKTFTDWVTQSYQPPENAAELIERGEALLLLDGLDELGSVREVEEINQDTGKKEKVRFDPRSRFIEFIPSNNKLLVTCRVRDYADIGEKIALQGAVTLKPLDDAQLRAYLQKQPELMIAIENDKGLREMLSTPLLLSFFAFAYQGMSAEQRQQLSNLSKSPGDLRDIIFRKYVNERYKHENRKPNSKLTFTLSQLYRTIGKLALESILDNFAQNRISIEQVREMRAELLVNEACTLHLLVCAEADYSFVHLRLRDFFAYTYSTSVIPLQDVDRSTRRKAVNALGHLGDKRAVEVLSIALHDADKIIRRNAAIALGKIQDKCAVEPLISALRDLDEIVRNKAARGLERMNDLDSLDSFIAALSDSNENVRATAAGVLGRIRDERAVEPLLTLIQYESHERVKTIASWALVRIGESAVNLLISKLNNDNEHENMAVWALTRIGTSKAKAAVERWKRNQQKKGQPKPPQ